MKYLRRAVKHFFYLMIILTIVIYAMVLLHFVDSDISRIFVNGYDSLWQIALIMAAFAAVYPRMGYSKRDLTAPGEYPLVRKAVVDVMEEHGYRIRSEEGENLVFCKRAPLSRALKMWEDEITFTRSMTGFEAEGLTRDVVRLVSAIEYRCRGGVD